MPGDTPERRGRHDAAADPPRSEIAEEVRKKCGRSAEKSAEDEVRRRCGGGAEEVRRRCGGGPGEVQKTSVVMLRSLQCILRKSVWTMNRRCVCNYDDDDLYDTCRQLG